MRTVLVFLITVVVSCAAVLAQPVRAALGQETPVDDVPYLTRATNCRLTADGSLEHQWGWVQTYYKGGWLAFFGLGGADPMLCGLHFEVNPPGQRLQRHGLKHIASHQGEFEQIARRIDALTQGHHVYRWESLVDDITQTLYSYFVGFKEDGKELQICRFGTIQWQYTPTGASYVKDFKLITQRAGNVFSQDVIGSLYPDTRPCEGVPARGTQPLVEIRCDVNYCEAAGGDRGNLVYSLRGSYIVGPSMVIVPGGLMRSVCPSSNRSLGCVMRVVRSVSRRGSFTGRRRLVPTRATVRSWTSTGCWAGRLASCVIRRRMCFVA